MSLCSTYQLKTEILKSLEAIESEVVVQKVNGCRVGRNRAKLGAKRRTECALKQ
jgi:hypothetical protein